MARLGRLCSRLSGAGSGVAEIEAETGGLFRGLLGASLLRPQQLLDALDGLLKGDGGRFPLGLASAQPLSLLLHVCAPSQSSSHSDIGLPRSS